MAKAKSNTQSLLWQQLVRHRPRGGRWLPSALQMESTRCPALPAEPRVKTNLNQPFATATFGSEFLLACVIPTWVNALHCKEGLHSLAPHCGMRGGEMSEDTIWGKSKYQCIPGAKGEFLRFSLTQNFKEKLHPEERYFFLGLIFMVKCFCCSISDEGCVGLKVNQSFILKARFQHKRLNYCDHLMLLLSPGAPWSSWHSLSGGVSQKILLVCFQ